MTAEQLQGFFVGWPNPPSPETHQEILRRSAALWLAWDGERCVGFINALSDGVFYAFIPLLEVLPEYQGQGIGGELVRRMCETLKPMYAIDIVCDDALITYYERHGFTAGKAMMRRHYDNQAGNFF
ncbi:MAG: GNAT family N-acetyltransferase [Armatimonas sp.]